MSVSSPHLSATDGTKLNAICPYFTMFPLAFPLNVLQRAEAQGCVLDPFCGRGTTNFAARLMGLPTIGIDSNDVAIAATAAKLAAPVTPVSIVNEARNILISSRAQEIPEGQFWTLAFHPETLERLCVLREALVENCVSAKRIALRGVLLGALHGPLLKGGGSSYFSNQSPRTYAPKPRYAVRYWQKHELRPPRVDVLETIRRRAVRYYSAKLPMAWSHVVHGDSRRQDVVAECYEGRRVHWIVTSPPYYGLRTYGSDQWLRKWFLGGPTEVDYNADDQISHRSKKAFADDLRRIWLNAAQVAVPGARLIVRFGAISDRATDPKLLMKSSLVDTPWRIQTVVPAGDARRGKRQAETFRVKTNTTQEFDLWAVHDS